MARRRKYESSIDGGTPYRDSVRRAFGKAAINNAQMIEIVKYQVRMLDLGDDVNALDGREKLQLQKVVEELTLVERRLLAVGRRCQRRA